MQDKKSRPGSLCHKVKLGLSRTNFFMSQNFRRPQIDPWRCPTTLPSPKFHADLISEVRLVVSLDPGALQHAWSRSMARMHGVQVADFERSIQVKTFKSCFLMHSIHTSKRQIAHRLGCSRYEDVATLLGAAMPYYRFQMKCFFRPFGGDFLPREVKNLLSESVPSTAIIA